LLRDRSEAGKRLAAELAELRGGDCVVLALPRGGVPIGFEIASELGAPLGLIMVRKIGVPGQPELALGAVADGGEPVTVFNSNVLSILGLTPADLEGQVLEQLKEIERRRRLYGGHLTLPPIEGRSVILVDDGIATGATTRVAIQAVRRRRPACIVLAVPVASADTLVRLEDEVDRVVCLEKPQDLEAISLHYRHFPQVPDEDVIEFLERAKARANAATDPGVSGR
jgi:predicted phosphoribosyltransferase